MPITQVRFKGEVVPDATLQALHEKLPGIVANILKVQPKTVGVDFDLANKYDVGHDIKIRIFAYPFRERRKNIDKLTAEIERGVRKIVEAHISIVVSIWLAPCGTASS